MNISIYKLGLLPVLLLGLSVCLPGCKDDFPERRFDEKEETMQIYDYIKTQPDLSVYKAICDYSGFYGQISTAGSYTAFIPNNEAFDLLFKDLKISKIEDKEPQYWLYYMKYHTIEKAKINSGAFENGNLIQPTMMGDEYYLSVNVASPVAIKVNGLATIVTYNLDMRNGYIQVIDRVLIPPIQTVYEMLKEDGGYTKMLSLFESQGLKSYLTDSIVTVMIEPDDVLTDAGFDPNALPNLKDWLKYHIIPNERSYITQLDKRCVQTLYSGDVTTFNYLYDRMWCNQKDYFSSVARYGVNKNALNGIYHSMGVPLQIRQHTAGKVRMNLYGRDNDKKGYKQNVFAELPARVVESVYLQSWHQGDGKKPAYPMCTFVVTQVGDAFQITIPEIVPGNYTIRLIYNIDYSSNLTVLYNNQIVKQDLKLETKDGDFPEYTSLKYKDCGPIEVHQKSDVALRFIVTKGSVMAIDMIELIPDVSFVPAY